MATSDSPLSVTDVTLAVARGAVPGGGSTPAGETIWGPYVDVATPEPTLLYDSFESATFDAPNGPAPAKNLIGFDWYNNQSFSICRDDGYVVHGTVGPLDPPGGPYPDKEIEAAPGSDGQHSVRVRYAAGREMTELSFQTAEYHTELWIGYWVKVPINFKHGSMNNKFLSIFPTRSTYDKPGTLTIQTRPDGPNGDARLVFQDGGVTVGESGSVPFISYPGDQGRWMHVVMRFKRASGNTANDGAYQFFRRWQDESDYTLMHSKLNAQLFNTTDPNGFKEGYVFGWANDPYVEDTEWFIDEFVVSDQPLVPVVNGPGQPDLTLPAGNIVSDDFSSGDLDAPNANGFSWGNSGNQRYTSLVTMDPATNDPTVVFSSGGDPTYNVLTDDPRDWTALHGDNSLRFSFRAGTHTNVFAEQRWGLIGRSEKVLWMRFALRVPTNFIHENVPDVFGEPRTVSSNNKLFKVWMDGYGHSGTGVTIGMEFRPNGNGGSSFYIINGGPSGADIAIGDQEKFPFISVADRGRWMYICCEMVTESTPGAKDGRMVVYRKWAGEPTFTKTHEVTNQEFLVPPDGSYPGWSHGYLLGADNSGYAEDTEFLLDDFHLSTESLL